MNRCQCGGLSVAESLALSELGCTEALKASHIERRKTRELTFALQPQSSQKVRMVVQLEFFWTMEGFYICWVDRVALRLKAKRGLVR